LFDPKVDSFLANALRRLLKAYNIKRTVCVEAVNDYNLWALIPKSYDSDSNDFFLNEIISDDLQLVSDPRIPQMGYRLLTRIGGNHFDDIIKYIDPNLIEESKLAQYQKHRFKLGVSEGYDDLLSGFYFPFECNGDYLNAVSLNKGLFVCQ
jgi:folate-binding Fe-S cluster repair protein YgfZ